MINSESNITGKNYRQHVENNTLLPKFHRFEGQAFSALLTIKSNIFFTHSSNLGKNLVQVLVLINKQGEAVKNWNAKI